MSNAQPLAHGSAARCWYGRLINLYPGAFRERYAAEMLQIFEESWSRVSQRGATARCRYWLHVLFDLIRTLPGEWLAATPLPTKVSLLVIGIAVSLCVIDHQWLTIALWLFSCAFITVCWTLIRPSRLGLVPSLLLAGALGWAGFWLTLLVVKFTADSHYHHPNTVVHCSVIVALLVVPLCKERLSARYPGWDTRQSQLPLSKDTFRQVLPVLPIIGVTLSQLQIIFSDSNIAGMQIALATFLCSTCVTVVTGQLAVIWRRQDHSRKADSEIWPA
jgi:hypothetical protein